MIILKSDQELARMRRAGRIVAQAHALVAEIIRPGITTLELDRAVADFLQQAGAVSTFLGYHGYPAHICTSVNEQVVHGIPGPYRLKEGDIVSVDIGVSIDGYCGDSAWTYPVGEVSEEARRLLEVAEKSLQAGIAKAVVGARLSDVSHAIQTVVEEASFSVVRDFVGHGIGRQMHEPPQVPNYGPPGKGPRLRAGMTLAIEPMVNQGTYEVEVLADQWTVVTKDGKLSAHFEHTVAITENGPEILTVLD